MDCEVINCKCSCHKLYPQERDIKALMVEQIMRQRATNAAAQGLEHAAGQEQTAAAANNSLLLFGEDDDASGILDKDEENLWERRRRIHRGEEQPLSSDEYKGQLPKLEDLMQTVTDFDDDDDIIAIRKKKKIAAKSASASTSAAPTTKEAVLQETRPQPTDNQKKQETRPQPTESQKKQEARPQPTDSQKKQETRLQPTESQKKQETRPQPTESQKKQETRPQPTDNQTKKSDSQTEKSSSDIYSILKPVALNPLHKYKVDERDMILKDIYGRAHSNIKHIHNKMDPSSEQFKKYVNDEATRLLNNWMEAHSGPRA